MFLYFLSLGSNLGDRQQQLTDAISLLNSHVGNVIACSSVIETEPWGFESKNNFLNLVLQLHTTLKPHELLLATKQIERQLGRREKSSIVEGKVLYADRNIDIDILAAFDEDLFAKNKHTWQENKSEQALANLIDCSLRISSDSLTLPHPHIFERDFVTRPLYELLSKG